MGDHLQEKLMGKPPHDLHRNGDGDGDGEVCQDSQITTQSQTESSSNVNNSKLKELGVFEGPNETEERHSEWQQKGKNAAKSLKRQASVAKDKFVKRGSEYASQIKNHVGNLRDQRIPTSKSFWVILVAGLIGFTWISTVSTIVSPIKPNVEISMIMSRKYNNDYQNENNDQFGQNSDLEVTIETGSSSLESREFGDTGKVQRNDKNNNYNNIDGKAKGFDPVIKKVPPENLGSSFDPQKKRVVQQKSWPIRVALYNGHGASIRSWNNMRRIMKCANHSIEFSLVKNANTAAVNRKDFDVLLIPGGESGKMNEWHQKHGSYMRNTARKFLRNGGGYVGFCAGAYLARGVFNVSPFRKASAALGVGWFSDVSLESWMEEESVFPMRDSEINSDLLYYANGPIAQELDNKPVSEEIKNPKVLLRMGKKSYVHIEHGPVPGTKAHNVTMYDKLPIATYNEFSHGRVLLSTGHPETNVSKGIHSFEVQHTECGSQHANMILNMIYMAANRTKEDLERVQIKFEDALGMTYP